MLFLSGCLLSRARSHFCWTARWFSLRTTSSKVSGGVLGLGLDSPCVLINFVGGVEENVSEVTGVATTNSASSTFISVSCLLSVRSQPVARKSSATGLQMDFVLRQARHPENNSAACSMVQVNTIPHAGLSALSRTAHWHAFLSHLRNLRSTFCVSVSFLCGDF